MPLRSLILDFNSYFASVEQQLRPELRGKPLGIVPVIAETTSCIAASREAKRFGVQTGTPVWEARKLCPQIQFIATRPEVYIEMQESLLKAIDTCIPVKKVWSIDEVECTLDPSEREPTAAIELSQRIKQAIKRGVGECLTCSIGLAPNRILAKLASDQMKPDGLVLIKSEELPERLYSAKLTDFSGIGERIERRLNIHGIYDTKEMCARSEKDLRRAWGSVLGAYWYYWLRGDEVYEVPTHTQVIGHEHVMEPNLRTREGSRGVLVRLIHNAAARARRAGFRAKRLVVWMNFREVGGWAAEAHLVPPTNDTLSILRAFGRVWEQFELGYNIPFKVGANLFKVEVEKESEGSLFEEDEKSCRLSQTMDLVNARYGKDKLYVGALHHAKHSGKLGIPFQHVPKLPVKLERLPKKESGYTKRKAEEAKK